MRQSHQISEEARQALTRMDAKISEVRAARLNKEGGGGANSVGLPGEVVEKRSPLQDASISSVSIPSVSSDGKVAQQQATSSYGKATRIDWRGF